MKNNDKYRDTYTVVLGTFFSPEFCKTLPEKIKWLTDPSIHDAVESKSGFTFKRVEFTLRVAAKGSFSGEKIANWELDSKSPAAELFNAFFTRPKNAICPYDVRFVRVFNRLGKVLRYMEMVLMDKEGVMAVLSTLLVENDRIEREVLKLTDALNFRLSNLPETKQFYVSWQMVSALCKLSTWLFRELVGDHNYASNYACYGHIRIKIDHVGTKDGTVVSIITEGTTHAPEMEKWLTEQINNITA